MIRNASIFVFVMASSLLASTGAAWAGDPSKIGQNIEHVFDPNVKSLWRLALIVGVVGTCIGRVPTSVKVGWWLGIVLAGMVIYNTDDFINTISNMGKKVL